MFTKEEILEIQRKLELSGKKVSQLPLVTNLLSEDIIPILQKKENKSISASNFSLYVQNQILPKLEQAIEASTGEIKTYLSEIYLGLISNSEDNKNEILTAIDEVKSLINSDSKVTLTVTSDTQDAHIYLNGVEQSSIIVDKDSIVSLIIKAEGFVTFNEVICVHRTQKIHINLTTISGPAPSVYKITINPTPSNASVKLDGEDCYYKYVEKGTYVDVEVSLEGYRTYKQSILVNADKVFNINLQPIKICKVSLDYSNFKGFPIYVYNSDNELITTITDYGQTPMIGLVEDTSDIIRVSQEHYYDSNYNISFKNEDYTITLDSVPKQYTLNVTSDPSNAVIKINEEVRNSIIVDYYTTVKVSASCTNYKTYTENILVTDNINKNITLEYVPIRYNLTFNINPQTAKVYINDELVDTSNPYIIIEGNTYNWRVTDDYYIEQSGSFVCTSDKVLEVNLERSFISYYSDLKVTLDGEQNITVPETGGNYALSITALLHTTESTTINTIFKYGNPALTLTDLSNNILTYTLDGDNNYIVNVPSYTELNNRNLSFKVSIQQPVGASQENLTYTYNITQKGVYLVTSPSLLEFNADNNDYKNININSAAGWSATNTSWVALDKNNGTTSDTILRVKPTDFTGNTARYGTVTINNSLKSNEISIKQNTKYIFEKDATNSIISVDATNSMFRLSVYFNQPYFVIRASSGLVLESCRLDYGSTITINPTLNNYFEVPSDVKEYLKTNRARIWVYLKAPNNTISEVKTYTASILQESNGGKLEYTLTQASASEVLTVNPSVLDFSNAYSKKTITINASNNWTLSAK